MKHVTWATPLLRMERTVREIGEELETGTREAARRKIREHIDHLQDLIEFLNDEQANEAQRLAILSHQPQPLVGLSALPLTVQLPVTPLDIEMVST